MSLDFALAWQCPHLTVEEHVVLDADRRSLKSRQPIASLGSVRLLVNDEVYVPQGGLFSAARLIGAVSGPFDIPPDHNTLTIRSPVGSWTYQFRVRTITRLNAAEVVRLLLRDGCEVATPFDSGGHLAFNEDSTVGPDSFLEVSGSAASILGFGAVGVNAYQRRAQGAMLYPGWQLMTPPDLITARFPKFVQPVKANPVFKLTYAVPGNRCLRCGGTLIENDVRFDVTGQAITIQNENLLYQAALKILLTLKGSNPYYLWYGSAIQSHIGGKALPGIATLLNEDVRRALGKLQSLQAEQSKYQPVSFKERLYSIESVNVQQQDQDQTVFTIDVTVRNASGSPIDLSIVFTVPSVVALMGSNGLSLGTDRVGLSNLSPPSILMGQG